MSRHRINPDAGFVNPKAHPKGPNGRGLCRKCGQEVPKGSRTFCSQGCIDAWKLTSSPEFVRSKLRERDHGVCASCGLKTQEVKNAIWTLECLWRGALGRRDPVAGLYGPIQEIKKILKVQGRTTFWDADHIRPVAEGGGECDLSNYQTLCVWCHRAKTARQNSKREGS